MNQVGICQLEDDVDQAADFNAPKNTFRPSQRKIFQPSQNDMFEASQRELSHMNAIESSQASIAFRSARDQYYKTCFDTIYDAEDFGKILMRDLWPDLPRIGNSFWSTSAKKAFT